MDQEKIVELRRQAVDFSLTLVNCSYRSDERAPLVSADVLLKNAEAIYQFLIKPADAPTS